MFAFLLIAIGIMWILQGMFGFYQNVRMKNTIEELKEMQKGKVFMGQSPGILKRKYYVIAAVNGKGVVTYAKKIRGMYYFAPAKVLPFDELVNQKLDPVPDIDSLDYGIRENKAIIKVAQTYQRYLEKYGAYK